MNLDINDLSSIKIFADMGIKLLFINHDICNFKLKILMINSLNIFIYIRRIL